MTSRLILACCALTLALAAVPASATPPLPGERIAGGVTAAGVDLAGLTVDEAAQRLQGSFGPRLGEDVIAQAADITFTLKAADATVTFDTDASAKRALYAGRTAAGAPVDVPLAVSHDQAAVTKFADAIHKRLVRPARDAKLIIKLKKVRATHSKPGRDVDAAALAKQIGASLDDPRLTRVFKPKLVAVKPKVTPATLRNTTVITITQSTFTLRLFKHLKVRKTYKVAVGQPAYPTPRGRFAIQDKQVNPTWSVPNSPWAGELAGTTVTGGSAANPLKARWMGIANGVGIHGTGEDGSIGSRASHGCIRMHVKDVIDLFPRVPVGTPVLIG
ncbi:MAG TPA: L,D-transpeptidase family protein [Solirubrobacteraceae bacterium]|jgi:lipoprotein-anchoring transpeptidase ErfK/SrfK|nr:L,D-transpeptidase family protein [Solirubrobacteraceae bacterium]